MNRAQAELIAEAALQHMGDNMVIAKALGVDVALADFIEELVWRVELGEVETWIDDGFKIVGDE